MGVEHDIYIVRRSITSIFKVISPLYSTVSIDIGTGIVSISIIGIGAKSTYVLIASFSLKSIWFKPQVV